MQPVTGNNSSGVNKCKETSSKCVVWDGPDIDCLGVTLCKGQSIEVIVYNTAKQLCDLLAALNITNAELECLGTIADPDNPNVIIPVEPKNIIELINIIIKKLCDINDIVIDLENPSQIPIYVTLPDCNAIIVDCPAQDSNGNPITLTFENANGGTETKLLLIAPDGTSPAVEYLAEVICDLLCRMATAESNIADLRTDVDNLMNAVAGALPSVNVPPCISVISPLPIADPLDQNAGAIVAIANVVCNIVNNITGDPTDGYPIGTTCTEPGNPSVDLALEPALGAYPGSAISTLEDLGAIPNASSLKDIINNILVAVCDLRNFGNIVKTTCCPSLCANILNTQWAPGLPSSGIGAVIPGGAPANRNNVQFFLNGTFTDAVTGLQVTADFANNFTDFTPPGINALGCSAPTPSWNLNVPVEVTISDLSGNTFTDQNHTLLDFITTPSVTFSNLNALAGLDPSENYLVSYSVTVGAPDCTTCTFTNSIILATTCDNQAVGSIAISDIGANGFTLDLTGIPVPAPGTTLTGYNVIVTPLAGQPLGPYFVDVGFSTYYFYPDVESYPGLANVSDSDPNWYTTDELDPNTQYTVCVQLVYNCGISVEVCDTFTTLVGIEINISDVPAGNNVLRSTPGTLTLTPVGLAPLEVVSANFSIPIEFNGQSAVRKVVSCSPNIDINFTFETLAINPAQYTSAAATNCTITNVTRGWGQVASSYFFPGYAGNDYFTDPAPQNSFFSPARLAVLDNVAGLITAVDQVGCYDYVISTIQATAGLGYTGPAQITNINDGGGQGPNNRLHGTYSYTFSSAIPYPNAITAPTNAIGTLNIVNSLHAINNSVNPRVYIKIDDTSSSIIANKSAMWYGTSLSTAGTAQSVACVEYIQAVKTLLGNPAISKFGPGLSGNTGGGLRNNPTALPIFMRIEHYKFNGTNYQAPTLPTTTVPAKDVYDITFDWFNNLPPIDITAGGLGYWLNSPSNPLINFKLRDKLVITFTGGVANDPLISNAAYNNLTPLAILATDIVPASVTINQNPFAGIWPDVVPMSLQTGPFEITGNSPFDPLTVASCVSYTNAITGYTGYNSATFFGVPLNNFLNGLIPPPVGSATTNARASNYWNPIEIVLSGDVTITWKVGS